MRGVCDAHRVWTLTRKERRSLDTCVDRVALGYSPFDLTALIPKGYQRPQLSHETHYRETTIPFVLDRHLRSELP